MAFNSIYRLSPHHFFTPAAHGFESVHPWVLTYLYIHTSIDGSTSTARYESYPKRLHLDHDADSVHLSNDGTGALVVTIGTDSFDIPDFESGRQIFGFKILSRADFHELKDDDTLEHSMSGVVSTITGSTAWLWEKEVVGFDTTYFLVDIAFNDGSVVNLRNGVPVTGTDAGETLQGFGLNTTTGETYGDRIDGRGGNDYLYGHAGDDTLTGGGGRDYMAGGVGDDTYVLNKGDGSGNSDLTGVYEEIGEGTDTIRINGIAPDALRIWSNGAGYEFEIGKGKKAGVEYVYTDIAASGGSDFWDRYESVVFDDGTVWTETGGLSLAGRNTGQTTEGTDRDDRIDGRGGNDYLYGHAGDDTLTGGKGRDYMAGGVGDDTYVLNKGDGSGNSDLTGVYEEIGEGTDTIRINGIAPDALRIWSNGAGYEFEIGNGKKAGVEYVYTDIAASGESDFWDRYESVVFDDGTVWTETGGLSLAGRNTGQTTEGTDRGDRIDGRGGNDYLYGHAGDDTLTGGKGRDYMAGGVGDDTYVLNKGDGSGNSDLTGVYEEIGEGTDTIRINGIAPDALRIWSNGAGYEFEIGKGKKAGVEYVYTDIAASGGSDFWDRYESVVFDDGTVWTETGGLSLAGRNTGQTTEGTDRGDRIDGRGGNDYLYGHAGDDTLTGGKGRDYMAGGRGADIFVFAPGTGVDTVADFRAGKDRLDVSAFKDIADFDDILPLIRSRGDGAAIALDPGTKIVLSDVAEADLSAGDFIFA